MCTTAPPLSRRKQPPHCALRTHSCLAPFLAAGSHTATFLHTHTLQLEISTAQSSKPGSSLDPGPRYLIIIGLLNKKCFSIISQFHVQVHRLPIDFYVNLKGNREETLRR